MPTSGLLWPGAADTWPHIQCDNNTLGTSKIGKPRCLSIRFRNKGHTCHSCLGSGRPQKCHSSSTKGVYLIKIIPFEKFKVEWFFQTI